MADEPCLHCAIHKLIAEANPGDSIDGDAALNALAEVAADIAVAASPERADEIGRSFVVTLATMIGVKVATAGAGRSGDEAMAGNVPGVCGHG